MRTFNVIEPKLFFSGYYLISKVKRLTGQYLCLPVFVEEVEDDDEHVHEDEEDEQTAQDQHHVRKDRWK